MHGITVQVKQMRQEYAISHLKMVPRNMGPRIMPTVISGQSDIFKIDRIIPNGN